MISSKITRSLSSKRLAGQGCGEEKCEQQRLREGRLMQITCIMCLRQIRTSIWYEPMVKVQILMFRQFGIRYSWDCSLSKWQKNMRTYHHTIHILRSYGIKHSLMYRAFSMIFFWSIFDGIHMYILPLLFFGQLVL